MTSTVLDVTVMLLCVSASVVALGGVGGDPHGDTPGPTASAVADRLSTETATVTYGSGPPVDGDSAGGVEPADRTYHGTLAELLAAAAATTSDPDAAGDDAADASTGTDDAGSDADRFRPRAVGVVSAAVGSRVRLDVRPERATPDGYRPSPIDDAGRGMGGIAVGSEPPRRADATAAVVTVPATASLPESVDRFRVVVRVW